MSANSFGSRFIVHTFGESHGSSMGAIIDGCPSGLDFDFDFLQKELNRRRPGSADFVTARNESDRVEVLSGIFEGKTLGTPIAMVIKNQDTRSADYENIQTRQGHADDTWKNKFVHTDVRGGGRASGRETVSRVLGGAVAKMLLQKLTPKTKIIAYAEQIYNFKLSQDEEQSFLNSNKSVDEFATRFPSTAKQEDLILALKNTKHEGESFGGFIKIIIKNPPTNLGQPVFHKLKSDLASAMMGIGAVTGIEFASAFSEVTKAGTEFHSASKQQYAGIRGGITTGEDIVFRLAMKPTSSILDVAKKGRHDPCILIRAIPVVEAMAALVLADHLLWSRLDRV